MPFKAKINEDFFIENNRIILSKAYFEKNKNKFKKITGSRLSSILNKNKYCSPFKVWTMMTNLYFEEMDETLSKVGNIIEPKIKNYVEDKIKIKFKQYNPFEVKWDVFNDNKIFGGIPDGEPINNKNEIDYENNNPMLEIKTTSIDSFKYKTVNGILELQKDENNIPLIKEKFGKKNSWFIDGKIQIPDEYKLQLSLYLYLRKVSKGIFAIAFLEKEDYAFPDKFICENREIYLVELFLENEDFSKIIDSARNWYMYYIEKGISPEFTSNDKLWLKDNEII